MLLRLKTTDPAVKTPLAAFLLWMTFETFSVMNGKGQETERMILKDMTASDVYAGRRGANLF